MSDMANLPAKPVPSGQLRVGDRERQEAVTALGDHFAVGRLDQQEFDERIQAAYAARTRVELERLFLDLPQPAPFREVPARPSAAAWTRGPRASRPPLFYAVLPLLIVALIVVTAVTHVPVFPLFFLWIWLGAGRWGRWGRHGGPRGWGGSGRYAGTGTW